MLTWFQNSGNPISEDLDFKNVPEPTTANRGPPSTVLILSPLPSPSKILYLPQSDLKDYHLMIQCSF